MAGTKSLGIDIGGTKILGVLCEVSTGDVVEKYQLLTPDEADEVPKRIAEVVRELLTNRQEGTTIGLGLPGLVGRDGILRYGPNVQGVLDLDMPKLLRNEFKVPVSGHNDGTCAAVAEHMLGAAKGYRDAVVITQGTGIGGGLIIDNKPVLGVNGFAGEPGHMQTGLDGKPCSCGVLGCWEAYASGNGFGLIAREYLAEEPSSKVVELAGGIVEHVRGEHVSAALDMNDVGAIEILRRFVVWTTAGIASLISLLDPGVVVLGGGLSSLSQGYVNDISEQLPRFLMGAAHRPPTPIVSAQLGSAAGAVGAAICGFEHANLS